ncbi:M20/M25/M40 family metallo-hydrolase [Salana multivorans]
MSASRHHGASAEGRAAELAARLAAMVREPTIATGSEEIDDDAAAPFLRLRALLEATYPTVFGVAAVEELGRHGLLLRLAGSGVGSGSGAAGGSGITGLGPCVLMAHQDVVPAPVQDWAAAGWSHPPFDGVVESGADGELTVHGRGTLDDKGALLVLLEAVESLLAGGWCPERDLYLLLGADEERDGICAQRAAALLAERGVQPALVLDEGGAVALGAFPGVAEPVAVVGIAEKGLVTLEVSVSADPRSAGHASTPPRRGAAAGLGRAINALERHPHHVVVDDVTVTLLETIAPLVAGPLRDVAARAGSLRPVLARLLPWLGGELAAMVRTTTGVTQLVGSSAPNVIAARASAVVNLRVATTQSVAEAVAHVDRVVQRAVHGRLGVLRRVRGGDVLTASVAVVAASEPSPPSPMDERWEHLCRAVAVAYPDAVAVPYTMLAASDSRFLVPVSDAVYRFAPLAMTARQRAGIHGVDEHVTADSLLRGVAFYQTLLHTP